MADIQQNKPKAVDLFSGIGGISLALHDILETVLYCEIDKYCHNVLVERMEQGKLHVAPIHSDVQTLHLCKSLTPAIIVAGFPCQDISSIGLQKGIEQGEKSSMFYQIIRLLDECDDIHHVFVENVSNILKCGMNEVIDELVVKRNWNMQWTLRKASSMGAPHQRSRWFCLASKANSTPLHTNPLQMDCALCDWKDEPAKRISFKPSCCQDNTYDQNWISRWHCLGNAVVPVSVRSAYCQLATCEGNWQQIASIFGSYSIPVEELKYPYGDTGLIYKGRFFEIPSTYDVNCNLMTHSINATVHHGDNVIKMTSYPTPRRGNTHPSSLTDRTVKDLPTILVQCEESKEYVRSLGIILQDGIAHNNMVPNINYIEWMMGFEKDWTKLHSHSTIQIQKQTRKPSLKQGSDDEEHEDAPCIQSNEPVTKPKVYDHDATYIPKKKSLNGMHMFMKNQPGKDVKQIARMWADLETTEKQRYSMLAKQAAGSA